MKVVRVITLLALWGLMLVAFTGSALATNDSAEYPGRHGDLGTTTSGLPFTGADIVVYVIVGVAILAAGLVFRGYEQRSHRANSDEQ